MNEKLDCFLNISLVNSTKIARESDRETGREICERLNVRPEIRYTVSWIFDEWLVRWPKSPDQIAFIKECFAIDDRKGIIAWKVANFYPDMDDDLYDECIPDYEDTVNALY